MVLIINATIQSKQALEAYGLSVENLSTVLDSTTFVAQATGVSVDDLMKNLTVHLNKLLGLSFKEAGHPLLANWSNMVLIHLLHCLV